MNRLGAILPKLGVFLVATIVGASIAYVVAAAANRPQLEPTAGTAPEYVMTADAGAQPGQIAAFDLIDAQQDLIEAKDDLTSALISHTLTRLRLWKNMGVLYIQKDGSWINVLKNEAAGLDE